MKKLQLVGRTSPKPTTSVSPTPTSGAKPLGDRVCDPCFNKHLFEAKKSKQKKSMLERSKSIAVEEALTVLSSATETFVDERTASVVGQETLDTLQRRGQLLEGAKESSDALEKVIFIPYNEIILKQSQL